MTKIRRKREAGYVERAPSRPRDASTKRALERAVCEDPGDRDAWAVYADFVQTEQPVLGERIMLALLLDATEPDQRGALVERIAALDERPERWINPTLVELSQRRGFGELAEVEWRMGMIDALRLRSSQVFRPQCTLDAVLAATLASPATRFMTTLSIEYARGRRPKEIEQAASRLVESGTRPALRTLLIDGAMRGAPAELPALERCLAIGPRLEALTLRGRLRMGRDVAHERLRHMTLSCAGDKASWVARLRGLRLPSLEVLRLRREPGVAYTTRAHELLGLCREAELPALTELHLEVHGEGNATLLAISTTPLFGRLRRVSIANVDNRAADLILDTPERFAHLERLDLRGGRIHGQIRERLRRLGNVSFY